MFLQIQLNNVAPSCHSQNKVPTPLKAEASAPVIDRYNHDTIGMVALDSKGHIASGTTTNGARNKIPG